MRFGRTGFSLSGFGLWRAKFKPDRLNRLRKKRLILSFRDKAKNLSSIQAKEKKERFFASLRMTTF